WLI
ncbi:ribosomal protein L15, partial [Vibrio parahaemolyticus EKP-028]